MANDKASEDQKDVVDVPSQVFAAFIEGLAGKDIDVEIRDRLQKALLVEKTYTDRALKEAIFPEAIDL